MLKYSNVVYVTEVGQKYVVPFKRRTVINIRSSGHSTDYPSFHALDINFYYKPLLKKKKYCLVQDKADITYIIENVAIIIKYVLKRK